MYVCVCMYLLYICLVFKYACTRMCELPEISKNLMYLSAAVVTSCFPSADMAREYMQPGIYYIIMLTAIDAER